ncbi:MAG: hypothetical protein HXX09_06705 [Bacteroidetes bacterium]|nr:hypothetical protein [Bacteroidota bacterium]
MKNTKRNFALLPMLIVLFFAISFSCKKDRIEPSEEKTLNEYSSVNNYLDTKKQDEQEFTIDSSGTGPIVGNQGTKIWADKNCLMFPNGDSVNYPYTVKLVELYTPKDMIYYQMPTIASGNLLETDGEIRLRAFKDGQELLIRPNCGIPIEMPNTAPKNYMRVFYGFETNSHPDWTDNPASLGVTTSNNPVFAATSYGYSAIIARLGWINCGSSVGNGTGHTINFTSSTDNLTNVGIFIYFPSTKTVMQVYNTVSGIIPNGSDVKIVGIAINSSGQLYSFNNNLNVTSSSTIDVILSQITDADLTTLLDNL